jgi:hypothetical protein
MKQTKLLVAAVDFAVAVNTETIIFRDRFISNLGGEKAAIKAIAAQQEIFSRLGEWPCNGAAAEEIELFNIIETAANDAWREAFSGWEKIPGDRGEHFEYTIY